MSMKTYLIIDIDGVLNSHENHKYNPYCGFNPKCVKYFNVLLDKIEKPKLIISSAWRYMIINGAMTIKGFEHLLKIGGLHDKMEVIGNTVSDETFSSRECQILATLGNFDLFNENYLIIDDLPLEFNDKREKRFIKTESDIGFSLKNLVQSLRVLKL